MSQAYGVKAYKLTGLVLIFGLSLLLIACGGGVSAEEFEAVKGELQTAQTQAQASSDIPYPFVPPAD